MINIPAGSFLMGSDPFTNIANHFEKPQHLVQIQAFAMGKYEVTQEQWHVVMGDNPSLNKGRKLPVENISWNEAVLFVQKLSQKTGKNYRLPTEAEWEYAARAGTTATYFWGDDKKQTKDYAWHDSISENKSQPVGLKNLISLVFMTSLATYGNGRKIVGMRATTVLQLTAVHGELETALTRW